MTKAETTRLASFFGGYPQVAAVYLFGSRARGTANRLSDLDLAVLLGDDAPITETKIVLLTGLAEAGFANADLLVLNNTPPLLRFEAVKHNRLLYARADFDAPGFFSRSILVYLDFAPFLDCQREYLLRHLRKGILASKADVPNG